MMYNKLYNSKFKVKDLGHLRYFLGIEVLRSEKGILFNKRKYTQQLISSVGLSGAKLACTYMEMNLKLTTVEYDSILGNIDDPVLDDVHIY